MAEKEVEKAAPKQEETVTEAPKKSYVIKNMGGIMDGDWFEFDPEYHEWVKRNYPDKYEGILQAIREQDKPKNEEPSIHEKTKAEVVALQNEHARVEAQVQAAIRKDQEQGELAQLKEARFVAQSQLDSAKEHLAALKGK